jgi:hypothetical protein
MVGAGARGSVERDRRHFPAANSRIRANVGSRPSQPGVRRLSGTRKLLCSSRTVGSGSGPFPWVRAAFLSAAGSARRVVPGVRVVRRGQRSEEGRAPDPARGDQPPRPAAHHWESQALRSPFHWSHDPDRSGRRVTPRRRRPPRMSPELLLASRRPRAGRSIVSLLSGPEPPRGASVGGSRTACGRAGRLSCGIPAAPRPVALGGSSPCRP